MNKKPINFEYFRTSDTKCASFLIASGHLPMSPPLIKHEKDGKVKAFWQFSDFKLNNHGRKFGESLRIWKQGIDFIEKNPTDKQALIMQALKTYDFLTDQLNRDDLDNTIVFYTIEGNTFSALKGTKKEKLLKEKYNGRRRK